jgi:alpha-glucoside transport system permease protein
MAARASRALTKAPLNILLLFIGVLWLIPTLGLFLDSLLAPDQIGATGWWKIFTEPSLATFENYGNVLDNDSITGALGTTLIVAIFGTAIPIFVGALAGYAFAWIEFPGREWIFLGVVALLVVPLQMALIPMFSLYNDLGIFDTALALILFHSAFGLPFAIFLLRNFFVGIPSSLLEAARMDGASEWRVYRHVVFPFLRPVTLSALIILGHISIKVFDLIVAIGGKQLITQTPAVYMWILIYDAQDYAMGAAIATLLLIGISILVIPYLVYSVRAERRS